MLSPPAKDPTELRIPRRQANASPLGFAALRQQGIALVQALSGEVWTDYNLHDPGVTLLETFCFALTERVYGAEAAIQDLLTGPDGSIDFARHALHPALNILPTRPVTREDYQRWVLDQVPDVARLTLEMGTSAPTGSEGLWSMNLQAPIKTLSPEGQRKLALQCARAYWGQRNLCEDLDAIPGVLAGRKCDLRVSLSIRGARELVEIVTDVFSCCAEFIACEAPKQGLLEHLEEGARRGRSLAECLEGPIQEHGWVESDGLAGLTNQRLLLTDLTRRLLLVDGIAEIRFLRFTVDGLDTPGGGLPLAGSGWALQLHLPQTADELKGVKVYRGGAQVTLPIEALLRRLQDLLNTPKAPYLDNKDLARGYGHPLSLPSGRFLPEHPFFPAQNHLPPIHQEHARNGGKQDQPSGATNLRGYLSLFEHWLAHAEAQCHHLRDLFSVDGDPPRSYWWQMLDEAQLPGITALYLKAPSLIQAEVFECLDAVLERRGRVLDYLLALHGETWSQNRLRRFGYYFDSPCWERWLFEQKRLLLQDIVRYSRDRMGALDYSRPSFEVVGNTPVIQEKVSILLGFKHRHSRSLIRALRDLGLELDKLDKHAPGHSAEVQPGPEWQRIYFHDSVGVQAPSSIRLGELAEHIGLLHSRRLPPAFWRCAVHGECYWKVPEELGVQLMLGPDEQGKWWRLAHLSDRPSAELHRVVDQLAQQMRSLMCELHLESEGLHLIEHVLLRPQLQKPDSFAEFSAHTLSAIFPAWTARGADREFRRLAEETVQINLPAHLRVNCFWLELDELALFESNYQVWLEAKVAHCADPANPHLEMMLDLHSEVLRKLLTDYMERSSGASAQISRS